MAGTRAGPIDISYFLYSTAVEFIEVTPLNFHHARRVNKLIIPAATERVAFDLETIFAPCTWCIGPHVVAVIISRGANACYYINGIWSQYIYKVRSNKKIRLRLRCGVKIDIRDALIRQSVLVLRLYSLHLTAHNSEASSWFNNLLHFNVYLVRRVSTGVR